MGFCVKFAKGQCGYANAGLPCPIEVHDQFDDPRLSPTRPCKPREKDSATINSIILKSLCQLRRPPIDESGLPPSKKLCRFRSRRSLLDLPGEIRNLIYRFVLLSDRPFPIKLQFAPLDTALLRVNKQVFAEASGIFYQENVFRFSHSLFAGPPILGQLGSFYYISYHKLWMMKKFVLEVPIYPVANEERLRQQVYGNLWQLTHVLARPDTPRMQVQLFLRYPWVESIHVDVFASFRFAFERARVVQHVVKDFHVTATLVDPRSLDQYVDFMGRYFYDNWTLEVNFANRSRTMTDRIITTLSRFSAQYQMPGLKEFYNEIWSSHSYSFGPRSLARASGEHRDKTA